MIGARTTRLVIEPMAHRHAAGLVAALGDDPSHPGYPAWPEPATHAQAHARLDHLARGPGRPGERWFNFVMRRAADGVVIGRLEATTYGGWAEVAYLVGPPYQGQGFAREGVRWLVDALVAAGVPELWGCVHPANAASLRVLEGLGFTRTAPGARALGSYEAGDVVLRRPA